MSCVPARDILHWRSIDPLQRLRSGYDTSVQQPNHSLWRLSWIGVCVSRAGTFGQNEGMAACVSCDDKAFTTYQDEVGQTFCKDCPQHTKRFRTKSAANLTACQCEHGAHLYD